MPLLKKKVFEKQPLPENLREDEEVFYCEITDEIFRDYEEFSERMFLYNSMVWTCCMTGKSNLTYQEALESEENAKKSLKEFPMELRLPILFLANKTQRTSFGELAEDVFLYVKDRYFIGENLESSFSGSKWKDSHVLQVIAPSEAQLKTVSKNGNNAERHYWPPANLFKYEIEHLDADDNDISEIMILDHNQLRRKKTCFSKEKCKLFLKQYCEQDSRGVFILSQASIDNFGINKIKFEQIFDGPLPSFEMSKRLEKSPNGKLPTKKKAKQETLAKFLTKNNGAVPPVKQNTMDLLEQMKKREEEFKLKQQQREEHKIAMKKKHKEEYGQITAYIKKWQRPKEDLLLEDQKPLPSPVPVKCKVSDQYIGDMLMIMEFVESFSKLLHTKDFFPGGFTLELMERALTEKEIAGPFTDIIQMFLTALFNVQDEESTQYRTAIEATSDIKEEELSDNLSLTDGTRLATLASSWSSKYQGLPLGRLPLYSVTVSEILRLHLLASGARINDTGARWRYAQRGGYTSEDDPGLHFRLNQAHILKSLAVHNVVQLPLSDKIQILSCLMNQLLTYADVRDIIEERLYKVKHLKIDLKNLQLLEKKREHEFLANKLKLQKEMKQDKEGLKQALEKLEKETEKKQIDNTRKISKMFKNIYNIQFYMGSDRAFRQYLRLDSVPGIFVSTEQEIFNECLQEITSQNPSLVNATRQDLLKHVRQVLFNEIRPLPKGNGALKVEDEEVKYEDLLMCSTDPQTCLVHSREPDRIKWTFIHDKFELEKLENSLNKRGERESELLLAVKNDKERLLNIISQTPVNILNPSIEIKDEEEQRPLRKKVKDRYEDANLGYPADMPPEEILENSLLDNILEMEEKISAGNLGSLDVKNRDEWRTCLSNKNYSEIEKTVSKKDKLQKVKKSEKGGHSRSNTPEIPPQKQEVKEYQDPGRFLMNLDNDNIMLQSENLLKSVKGLAFGLSQVAKAVDSKYLKKPLGHADMSKNEKKQEHDVLDKWEQSLLASTSYSQVFLHYGTLDSCVMWSRSALLARCRICRRQKDSENMLLCDHCNLGHHLYCLKPKLTSIPKGDWFCDRCKKEKEKEAKLLSPEPAPAKKRRIFRDEDVDDAEESENSNSNEEEIGGEEEEEESDSEDMDEDDDRDFKVDICKTCGSGGELITCEKCLISYHIECCDPPLRRAPRGSWSCSSCKDRYSDSGDETLPTRRSNRREETRDDLPLHNVQLQELLSDVMKQDDAWPFLRPVQTKEVPDYYDVITNPMDFGTIKYKLNMGKYSVDGQLMQDSVLVFENCNTYNDTDADVYKCGVRLLKYFVKRAKELGLKLPEEMESADEPKTKKRRKL